MEKKKDSSENMKSLFSADNLKSLKLDLSNQLEQVKKSEKLLNARSQYESMQLQYQSYKQVRFLSISVTFVSLFYFVCFFLSFCLEN
jgi:hypothetical protein